MCESPRNGVLWRAGHMTLTPITVSPTSVTGLPSLYDKIPNDRKQTLQNTTHLTHSNQSVLAILNGTSLCLPSFPLGDHTAEWERAVPSAHDLVTGISRLADLWSFLKSHSHELRLWNWLYFLHLPMITPKTFSSQRVRTGKEGFGRLTGVETETHHYSSFQSTWHAYKELLSTTSQRSERSCLVAESGEVVQCAWNLKRSLKAH